MGKLMNQLQKQLKTPYKKEAEDCIKIYNQIKEQNGNDRVWSSQWTPLATVRFEKGYFNKRIYYPTSIGYTFLKGIET